MMGKECKRRAQVNTGSMVWLSPEGDVMMEEAGGVLRVYSGPDLIAVCSAGSWDQAYIVEGGVLD